MARGKKTGGRVKKNVNSKKITFLPTDEALEKYDSWQKKGESLNKAIIQYKEPS